MESWMPAWLISAVQVEGESPTVFNFQIECQIRILLKTSQRWVWYVFFRGPNKGQGMVGDRTQVNALYTL